MEIWQHYQGATQKGLIERIEKGREEGKKKHYIPHNGVFTPAKDTTKVTIVHDAPAKTKKTSSSMNVCLYRGTVILEDLCRLLMRFQIKRVGIIADI